MVDVLKPGASTLTFQGPAFSSDSVKLPSSVVLVSRTSLVSRLVAVTFAPLTTAPLGSVTVPVMLPRSVCAKAAPAQANQSVSSASRIDLLAFIWASKFLQRVARLIHRRRAAATRGAPTRLH